MNKSKQLVLVTLRHFAVAHKEGAIAKSISLFAQALPESLAKMDSDQLNSQYAQIYTSSQRAAVMLDTLDSLFTTIAGKDQTYTFFFVAPQKPFVYRNYLSDGLSPWAELAKKELYALDVPMIKTHFRLPLDWKKFVPFFQDSYALMLGFLEHIVHFYLCGNDFLADADHQLQLSDNFTKQIDLSYVPD